MTQINDLADQRQELHDAILASGYTGSVYPTPRDGDYTPPAVVIQQVVMAFEENSKLAIIAWELTLMGPRVSTSSVYTQLEADLQPILMTLGKGANIGFVLVSVDELVAPQDPGALQFPGYTILGTSPYRNCE